MTHHDDAGVRPLYVRCPACDAHVRELVEVARAGARVIDRCAACAAESKRVAHELRLKALGALAQW
jgi:hypothetical protein